METQLLFSSSGSNSTSFVSVPRFYLLQYKPCREHRRRGYNCISDLSALHYSTNKRRCLLKFTGSPDEQNAQEGGKKSEGRHTVQSNEICYSGPFYTHLITRSNRFCETPSPFEDTPTTHVIWLVFYMRYQPRPIMRADHNVPVIRWGGDSVRRNHNLGQLKTDPWISGSHNAL